MSRLCAAFFLAALAGGAASSPAAAADLSRVRTLFVDQSLRPDARSLTAFDLNVLHPDAALDMEPGHALGSRYLALLDVSLFHTGTQAAMTALQRQLPSTPDAADSRARWVDLTHEQWLPWAVQALADPAVKRGFDGFVLSLGAAKPEPAAQNALLSLAAALRQRYSDKCVLLDLRSGLGAEVLPVADGFLALGVYTRAGQAGAVEWRPIAETQQLCRRMRKLQVQGLPTFAVDFAPADDRSAAREAAQRLTAAGALPFITTPALSGANLGPLEEISRRVLVLHGWDERHTGQAAPAAESTAAARFLGQTLEWLGCQTEYRQARGMGADLLPPPQGLAAVILDSSLVLSEAQQASLAAWLPALRSKQVPLLLMGMPFTEEAARQQALQHLGMGGSGRPVSRLAKTSIAAMDSTLLRSGARPAGRTLGFLELAAPQQAHVVLALRSLDSLGGEHRFDQIFLAPWGGAWLEPALDAAGPQIDVPAFLTAWLAQSQELHGPAPVPDTTTRGGRRIFYSHIDSAGFATPSALPGFPICAEVMRDRIIDRYLLPVTVAVCEAELRGWLPDQEPAAARQLQHTARTLFSLPQVQAASGSFSRPQVWTAGIPISAKLNDSAETGRLDMEREIAGSLSYIHRQLLPQGKRVSLMLWPENSTPTQAALSFCAAMGVPSLPATAPGGAAAPAAAGAPRLEPMAVRCRFDDVRTEQGIKALEKIFDACAGEPLHAMTAAAYAASVQDARQTRVLRAGDQRWIILNSGACRTLRLPATAGVPDMTQCLGVSGYQVHQGQLYIHTMGNVRTDLVLTKEKPARHLHLAESSATVDFLELASGRATFQVRDLRPVEVVLGGFEPNGVCAYLENNRPYTAHADATGHVRLKLVCRAMVSVQSLPPATQAVMR